MNNHLGQHGQEAGEDYSNMGTNEILAGIGNATGHLGGKNKSTVVERVEKFKYHTGTMEWIPLTPFCH